MIHGDGVDYTKPWPRWKRALAITLVCPWQLWDRLRFWLSRIF